LIHLGLDTITKQQHGMAGLHVEHIFQLVPTRRPMRNYDGVTTPPHRVAE